MNVKAHHKLYCIVVIVYFNFSLFEQDVSGAVQVVTAKDIPQNGKNDFISPLAGDPELVCSNTMQF